MQCESSFRDLKSHRSGHGLEDSLTGKRHRLEILILLLVNAMATFASWLAGLACEATGIDYWRYLGRKARKLYSTSGIGIGREALMRSWPMDPIWNWIKRLRILPETVLDQMLAPS
jgi:hypothetical protein